MADVVMEIKKLLSEDKLVIGGNSVVRGLRSGTFSKIYFAANCSEQLREDIERYASIANVEIVDTGIQNTELGDICKKPFAISVLGLKK